MPWVQKWLKDVGWRRLEPGTCAQPWLCRAARAGENVSGCSCNGIYKKIIIIIKAFIFTAVSSGVIAEQSLRPSALQMGPLDA